MSVLLRLALACINTQSNDRHIPVIRIIAYEHRMPEGTEAWEAFQPKLYYVTVAAVWRLLKIHSERSQERSAQLVSCAAGVATLLVALWFLKGIQLFSKVKFLSFALIAFNPALVGINAQATNDSFVILFATVALYFGYCFFANWDIRHFFGLAIGAILTGLSKGNGLVVPVAVLLTFAAAVLWWRPEMKITRPRVALYGLGFAAIVLPAIWFIGPYGHYHRKYGSAFVTNAPELYSPRPGITSIAHGLLTFRFLDMLEHPYTTNGWQPVPRHRTSLWSQLYGQAHFIFFQGWPPSWDTRNPVMMNTGRALLVLALLPTGLLVQGMWNAALWCAGWLRRRLGRSPSLGPALLAIGVFGYLSFAIAYAVRLPDFSSMKAIFVLPGLLGFLLLFSSACEAFFAWSLQPPIQRRWAARGATAWFASLLMGYVANISELLYKLYKQA